MLSHFAFSALFISSSYAQASGTFDFLTYNVAGLPAFLSGNGVPGDKATNAGTIGSKLAEGAYDVVHLQEVHFTLSITAEPSMCTDNHQDFNYHAYIYETDNHPYRTPTSGGVPFGSGLNTVANYNWNVFNRITWDQCFINEADCLTPKGFSLMRVQLGDGVEVDFYNLHADAG